MTAESKSEPGGDDVVPKLPRGRGLKLSKPELFRIGLTMITLVGLIVMAGPCANAVSGFMMGFEDKGGSASQSMPRPGRVDQPEPQNFEQLKPGMTEAELKAAIERAKARAAGSGSAAAAGSGSATPGTPVP